MDGVVRYAGAAMPWGHSSNIAGSRTAPASPTGRATVGRHCWTGCIIPTSIAGLRHGSAWVSVGPPLCCSGQVRHLPGDISGLNTCLIVQPQMS